MAGKAGLSGAFLRFVLVGGVGFLVDAGLTQLLVWRGLPPWLARCPALVAAMFVTWFANRHFTYRVAARRNTAEGLRYTITALTMAAINYTIYNLLVWQGLQPVIAITIATALQTGVSFFAYRVLVFGQHDGGVAVGRQVSNAEETP